LLLLLFIYFFDLSPISIRNHQFPIA
jgi:hypothetical protein